jgi:hypothetical protein
MGVNTGWGGCGCARADGRREGGSGGGGEKVATVGHGWRLGEVDGAPENRTGRNPSARGPVSGAVD